MADGETPSVTRFREYLRIKTVQPKPDYESCKNWLLNQAKEIGLTSQVFEVFELLIYIFIYSEN